MGFNISGLVINKNYQKNFDELQNTLGWNLRKGEEIDFETATSNWKEENYCDVYFSENGTIIFLNIDYCTEGHPLDNLNTLTFGYSEVSMTFLLDYFKKGIEYRSIMEVDGERIVDEGKKLEVEEKSEEVSEIIWNQIEVVLGKNFHEIDNSEIAHRYYFVQNESTNNDFDDKENQLNKINILEPLDVKYFTDDELIEYFNKIVIYCRDNKVNFFLHPTLLEDKNKKVVQNLIDIKYYIGSKENLLNIVRPKFPMEGYYMIGKFKKDNVDFKTSKLLFDLIENYKVENNENTKITTNEVSNNKWIEIDKKLDDNSKASDSDFVLLIIAIIVLLVFFGGLIYVIYDIFTLP
jgi:hypothetical protein